MESWMGQVFHMPDDVLSRIYEINDRSDACSMLVELGVGGEIPWYTGEPVRIFPPSPRYHHG